MGIKFDFIIPCSDATFCLFWYEICIIFIFAEQSVEKTFNMPVDQICYSEKYFDDKYEYR